jgi:hypothetical protein
MKEFEIRITFTDHVIGMDKEEAVTKYRDWLMMHTKDWDIHSIKEIGRAW